MKKALTILGLGALAVLCALPVLTLGVSAASLYYVMAKCLRRGRGSPFQEFFRAFRQNLLTGLGLTVILALLLVVAYFSALYLVNSPLSVLVTAFYALTLALSLFFALATAALAFPALSRFRFKAGQLLGFSLRLIRRGAPRALAIMLITAAAAFAAYLFPPAALILAGPLAYCATFLAEPLLRSFTPEKDAFPEGTDTWFLE